MRSFLVPLLGIALLASGCSAFAQALPGCVSRRTPASALSVSRRPVAAPGLRMAGFGKPSESFVAEDSS
ncbi:hypothetical protein T484DRAFT_1850575 [Baffinella frigidus]|nr:hypothetical protein T484DRAFT_1850575 [Cryptophyta sp. CCMP2293]